MNVAVAPLVNGLDLVSLSAREGEGGTWRSLLAGIAGRHVGVIGQADTRAQRNVLAARLDQAVAQGDRPMLLIAEGESCFAAAWWARLTPTAYVSRIAGALLVDPVDAASGGETASSRFASPRIALPFPSLLVDSRAGDRAALSALTRDWGSRLVGRDLLASGQNGVRAWRYAQRMVERFTAGIVERDVLKAEKLRGDQ